MSLQRRRVFRVFVSFVHCRNVLHKGVDIEMGLEHREDEFSSVKLASLQESTTQGCRFTKKNAMGETKNKLCSKPNSLKLCVETSSCYRN